MEPLCIPSSRSVVFSSSPLLGEWTVEIAGAESNLSLVNFLFAVLALRAPSCRLLAMTASGRMVLWITPFPHDGTRKDKTTS